jgi:hypothetical protein
MIVFELWHLPSSNMVGSWDSAGEAVDEIREGLAGRDASVLDAHALVSVDDDDQTRLVAEGAAIPDALEKLRLVDDMQSALDRSASVRDVLVRETLAIYERVTGGGTADGAFREHLDGFVAGRLADGTLPASHGDSIPVKKAG